MGHISAQLPIDRNGEKIQTLEPDGNVADDIDGVTDNNVLPTNAAPGEIIRVSANTDCYINFGTSGVTAAATDILFVNGVEYFVVPSGATHIAYLQVSAAGRLSVTHMV